MTTHYTLDLNAGLTQVLQDGTNSYLYGVNRIAQVSETQTGYFLPDALGSVRQMTDEEGEVTLTQSYAPYGEVLESQGTATTDYAFTGEDYDALTGLVYMRARYYQPADGRFVSKDIWPTNVRNPMSYNSWLYVTGDPINYKDPTGHIEQSETGAADQYLKDLLTFGITIKKDWGPISVTGYIPNPREKTSCEWRKGNWILDELKLIKQAAIDLNSKMNGKMNVAVKSLRINKIHGLGAMSPPGIWEPLLGDIVFDDLQTGYDDYYKHTFVHEFGHVWDYQTGNQLSYGLMQELGTWDCLGMGGCHWDPYKPTVDASGNITYPEPPPDTLAGCEISPPGPQNTNPILDCKKYPYASTYGKGGELVTGPGAEDWSQSLAYYVYINYESKIVIGIGNTPIRKKYIEKQINNLH